jgi:hypothetical protein
MPQSAAIQEKLKKFEQNTSSILNYNRHDDYKQNQNYECYKQQGQSNDKQEFIINSLNNEFNNKRVYSGYGDNIQAKRGLLDENRVCKYYSSQIVLYLIRVKDK